MLFVVENNLFASHMHISLRQPSDMISRFAVANDIPYELVDGNDVVAVVKAAKRLIGDIRSGKGPRLLELVTYRWYGHVDWRDDVDVGVDRSMPIYATPIPSVFCIFAAIAAPCGCGC
jgi:pyruvate dehydrogenase E1 component alpha subunit